MTFPFFIHFCCAAQEPEEPPEKDTPLIDKLAAFYTNSSFFKDTKVELDQFSGGRKKKKSSVYKEVTYTTSFCHQLRWISRRSFKNLLGNPQASVAQVPGGSSGYAVNCAWGTRAPMSSILGGAYLPPTLLHYARCTGHIETRGTQLSFHLQRTCF